MKTLESNRIPVTGMPWRLTQWLILSWLVVFPNSYCPAIKSPFYGLVAPMITPLDAKAGILLLPICETQFPGKYETGVDIKQGEWFHAKFVIKGKSLKVFVNGSDNPILTVDPMLDGVSKGSVGVWGWDSYFANFKYTPD